MRKTLLARSSPTRVTDEVSMIDLPTDGSLPDGVFNDDHRGTLDAVRGAVHPISKGVKESWTGYKAHIDVACGQIPVSFILSAASLHDSQVAIPLMTMTAERIDYLYEVMDAAYDADAIHKHSQALGHVAVIDPNYRADHALAEQWAAEVKRCSFINMPDCDDVIYDFRTMAERVNARLKDEFGGRFVRVRGAVKVKCHLMFGILALTADQLIRLFKYDPVPA